jgi:hypothetical protein
VPAETQLITFFIPLNEPIPIEPNQSFHARRDEPVPWLESAPWPKRFDNLRDILKDQNFVAIQISQQVGPYGYDLSRVNAALSLAMNWISGEARRQVRVEDLARLGDDDAPYFLSSVLSVQTVLIAGDDGDLENAPTEAFERVLEEIRSWQLAYSLTADHVLRSPLNRYSVSPLIPYVTYDPFKDSYGSITLMQVNIGWNEPPTLVETMTGSEVEKLAQHWTNLRTHSPIYGSARTFLAADRLLTEGDFSSAIVQMHTAGEVFLDALLQSLVWEERKFQERGTPDLGEIAGWFSHRSSLQTRMRSRFHTRLRGWTIEQPSLDRWLSTLTPLRNRVVHAGYEATVYEAEECREIVLNLRSFVLDDVLLADRNRTRYPRTTLMFVSREGLIRRGRYNGQIKRVDEASLDEDWIGELQAFRRLLTDRLNRHESALGANE